ncbi:MAG: hypothetical protein M0Z64_11065 [Nitrospiraceae bacterium]|nr:hypothetical protein [Nitrospiraceae bacterium]
MFNPTIVSLAVLKANWDHHRGDFLENFVLIVAESIKLLKAEIVTLQDVQNKLKSHFGLNLPQNAIETILKRVKKRGYLRKEREFYKKVHEQLDTLNYHDVQQDVLQKHERLIEKLKDHCNEKFNVVWSQEEADNALQAYLKENQYGLLNSSIDEKRQKESPEAESKRSLFIVANFVKYLQEDYSSLFGYFEDIVKGSMLADAVFLPDPGRVSRKFRNTDVYFDTPFLINALGYAGLPRQSPCIELLDILYDTGANLRCFRHTVDEIRGILDAIAYKIHSNNLKDAYGPTLEYFIANRYTASDIELLSTQLEKKLQTIRIKVVEKPDYEKRYVPDEAALEATLKANIEYAREDAAKHDVDSISAIIRLRRGKGCSFIEDCPALFVTTNVALADASQKFSLGDLNKRVIPPCYPDFKLTTILWLKNPINTPNLPRKRIIADYYAAIQPDDRLWRRYVSEINKLQSEKQVSEEDFYTLRYSLEAKETLMEKTLGDETAFTRGTVHEILDMIKTNIEAERSAAVEVECSRRCDAEREVQQSKDAIAAIREQHEMRIRSLANKIARSMAVLVEYAFLTVLVVALLYNSTSNLLKFENKLYQNIISLILFLMSVLTFLNMQFGTTVKSIVRKIEVKLATIIEKKIIHFWNN